MKEWMIVYEDPAIGESTFDTLWEESAAAARTEFQSLFPEVTRIIGVYQAKTVGCSKAYSGLEPAPDAAGLTVSAADDPANVTRTIITVVEDLDEGLTRMFRTTENPPSSPIKYDEKIEDGWNPLPDNGSISSTHGWTVEIADADDFKAVVKYGQTTAVIS